MSSPDPKAAKPTDTVRKGKKNFALSTQRYLPIAEIKDDTLVLKNGGLRAIIKVNAVNFSLKSEAEQQGIIAGYQAFVNTLLFPVQIVVRSTRLNIDPYINDLRTRAEKHKSELLKTQTLDYAEFMEKLVNVADIMQKTFYIIVPADGAAKLQRGIFNRFIDWLNVDDSRAKAIQRTRDFRNLSKILRDRATLVQSGLDNIGVTMHRLNTQELVQLFYQIYNPETSQKEKFGSIGDLNLDASVLM